jgi:hypothetical protein
LFKSKTISSNTTTEVMPSLDLFPKTK